MNKLGIAALAVAALILSAASCAGGSGSAFSLTPGGGGGRVSYSAKLVFAGAIPGAVPARAGSSVAIIRPLSTLAGSPIMVISPINADGTLMGGDPASSFGGSVWVVVSPAPSSSPTITITAGTNYATMSPVVPVNTTAQPDAIAEYNVASSEVQPNATASATAQANIGAPVNESPTASVYVYAAIALDCESPVREGAAQGWAWNVATSSWQPVSDSSQADIFMTGPDCPGSFYQHTSDGQAWISFPGGGTLLPSTDAWNTLSASSWANTETSSSEAAFYSNGLLLAKTRTGLIFKAYPNIVQSLPGTYAGAACVSGSCPDGF